MSWRQRPSNGRKRVRRGAEGKTGVQIKGTAQKMEKGKKKTEEKAGGLVRQGVKEEKERRCVVVVVVEEKENKGQGLRMERGGKKRYLAETMYSTEYTGLKGLMYL